MTASMRIGLTGASGVLGTCLAQALTAMGQNVVAFDGDVRDADKLNAWAPDLDCILHAAALVPVMQVEANPSEAIAVNVGGAANAARAASRATKCRLVYLSTSHVYKPSKLPLVESGPTEPISLYGLSKLQGEAWVRKLTPGALIIRIFGFYDLQQPPPFLIPTLYRRIADAPRGSNLDLANGSSIRDIADANWIAKVCAELTVAGREGTVNCATGIGHSVHSIAQLLAGAMDRNDISWRATDETVDTVVGDVVELKSRLGKMTPFDLPAGLKRYASQKH